MATGVPEIPTDSEAPETRKRFREEVRRSSHTTGVVAGVVAIIAFPAWIAFDWLVVPSQAADFGLIRLFAVVPLALLWGGLFTDLGRRRPELLILGMVSVIEIAIALMIAQLDSNHAAYALGFTSALFASAFLLIWPPRYSVAVVVISLAALALSWVFVGDGASGSEIATVAFFVITASVVSIAAQMIRERESFGEFEVKVELEREQERTRNLVAELERQSHEDALSGLANRRAWDDALERECARAERASYTFSVLLCDVDRLKLINDDGGHAAGDEVIRRIAAVLAQRVRRADLAARIGGDEFAILLAGADLERAGAFAEEVRAEIERQQPPPERLDPVTTSIGVAEWQDDADDPDALMARADRRLYVAKSTRNSVATSVDIHVA